MPRMTFLETYGNVGNAGVMKMTVDLDRDVVLAVKDMAATQKRTAGEVLSELARSALRPKARIVRGKGFRVIAKVKDGVPVTMELVNRLRDELP
jgi:hypothetical protein